MFNVLKQRFAMFCVKNFISRIFNKKKIYIYTDKIKQLLLIKYMILYAPQF